MKYFKFIIGAAVLVFMAVVIAFVFFSKDSTVQEEKGEFLVIAEDKKLYLQVPLASTLESRVSLVNKMKPIKFFDYRSVFDQYIDKVGANGIIDSIHQINLLCHDEAHDLGKVIYSKLGRIGTSLRTCNDSCSSGCMHGVLMEAFSDKLQEVDSDHSHGEGEVENHSHIDIEDARTVASTLCNDPDELGDYRRGDCAHGVGHALMFLSSYDVPQAVNNCSLFDQENMEYECATGAYMEYVTINHEDDEKTEELFHPCDSNEYPAACFRYKMVQVAFTWFRDSDNDFTSLQNKCQELEGKYLYGCYHGLGNALSRFVIVGQLSVMDICGGENENVQKICIDGIMERMGRYTPSIAFDRCSLLEDSWQKDYCFTVVERGMYHPDKDYEFYLLDN